MKFILFILAGFLLLYFNQPEKQKYFELSDKQKAEGWYLEPVEGDIAKLMYSVYGCIKYVNLIAPELKFSKITGQSVQTIDLRDADTSQYSGMFVKKNLLTASGLIGYPVRIGNINFNGLLDIYGAYKWVQDFRLANGCVTEYTPDSTFVLKRIYGDTLIEPLPITDLDKDGLREMNFRQNRKFAQLKSQVQDSFPDSIAFLFRLWKGGGGEVSAEVLEDFDKDGNMDMVYVGDDTLPPVNGHKIFIAEYNDSLSNFEDKFRYFPEDKFTYGHSYGDFDEDGKYEIVTGSIHGDVYVFENSGNDSYGLIFDDTISTSNAYLTVATNDIDKNGKTEFFIGGSSYFNGVGGTRFYWFEADGDNSYKKIRSFFLLGVDPLSWDEIHVFDANNDGKDDILINYTYAVVILTWNNKAQMFEVFYLSYWEHPVHGVTMYDLNHNGKLDFFISVLENENIPALRTYYYENKIVTSVNEKHFIPPEKFQLLQNFPNPFNNSTKIKFTINKTGNITLLIYNTLGKEVKALIRNKTYNPGAHIINWDATDNNGKEVSSGIYICVLSDGQQKISGKMLLIK